MRLIAVCLVAVAAAGCTNGSTDRSVLMAGVRPGSLGKPHRVDSREAVRQAASSRGYFLRQIRVAARTRPGEQFDSPPLEELLPELRHQAKRHHFQLVSVRMLHPRQLAPLVVVRTTHYVGLARATRTILQALDGRYGDRYEAFFFEARDERGVPFFSTYAIRRDRVEGGQWARSEALYPFAHG